MVLVGVSWNASNLFSWLVEIKNAEIVGQGSMEAFSQELEFPSVEHHALHTRKSHAVGFVAEDVETIFPEVHADLVGAAGFRCGFNQAYFSGLDRFRFHGARTCLRVFSSAFYAADHAFILA